jgi:hypothetical protein
MMAKAKQTKGRPKAAPQRNASAPRQPRLLPNGKKDLRKEGAAFGALVRKHLGA